MTVMRSRSRVSATAMAAATNSRLFHDDLLVSAMQEHCQQRCPEEKDRLHDAHRKRGLQHGACLVDVQGVMVDALAVLAKGTERYPHRATVPMGAVCVGDKAQLIDTGNEGPEEEEVHEGDEGGGALSG